MEERHGDEKRMTDYYCGLGIGALIGYCFALLTLLVIWSLCVIAKREEERSDYYVQSEAHDKATQHDNAGVRR